MSMLHKNLNLSPIRRTDEEKENLKTESKLKDFPDIKFNFDTKAMTKKEKETKANAQRNSSLNRVKEDPKVKYPKNINEYRHIMVNFQIVHADMNWILDLRTNKELSKYKKDKPGHMWPPSFYDEDLNKYQTRMKSTSKETPSFGLTGNLNSVEHLARDRLGATGNWSQLEFGTTLRNFRPYETVHGPNAKWKNLPYKQKNREMTPFLPPTTNVNKKAFKNLDKFIPHPVAPVYDEVVIGSNITVKRRRFEPNKTETLNFFGEHISRDKYSDVYKGKNVNEVRHILSYHSNTLSRFELGLRHYEPKTEAKNTNSTNKTIENKTKES